MAKQKKLLPLPKLDLTDKKQGFMALAMGILAALLLNGFVAGYWLLALGVVAGLLNIFHKEGVLFLLLGLTMTFMLTVLATSTLLPDWAMMLFRAETYLLAPATLVVSLKVLYALATK